MIASASLPSQGMCDRNVRLALFSGNYNCVKDGAAVVLNRLVAFLEGQGIETLVFSPTVKEPAFEPAGTLVPVRSFALPIRKEYRVALGLPRTCRKRLAVFRPTLFHLSAPDLLGYAALRLARQSDVPVVASFHTRFDTYLQYYGYAWLEKHVTEYLRHFYQRCEQVYAPSQSIAAMLSEQRMAKDLRIWPHGVDCTLFHPTKRDQAWRRSVGIGDHDVVVCFVGRLVREKGLRTFANVLKALSARGIRHRTLVIGDGPERHWLHSQLPNAIFTGFLTGNSLARGYASSDVFFFPSITETFGIVTLEAMACGVPSVCAKAPGSSSLVRHGVTGFLATPDDEADYVTHVTKLVLDVDLRLRMSKACLECAQGYDWDAAMRGLLSNYQELMEAHSTAHRIRPADGHPDVADLRDTGGDSGGYHLGAGL